MPRLYFKYGVMGSSKSAQALICKFNYEQKGFNVLLLKPSIDTRDYLNGESVIKSRIGISSPCTTFTYEQSLQKLFEEKSKEKYYDVVIIDEAQFCSKNQIDELKDISLSIPVLCYGLKTNFKSELFEGSKRLIEIADSIDEIKSVCRCGEKAIINARIINGKVVTTGDEVDIGGDEKYEAMCYHCYKKLQEL